MPVRDPLTYKSTSQWAAWTPFGAVAWTATGTDPAIGNGTLSASYRRIGTTGFYRGVILMGSTTTYGTGGWEVSLPDGWTASNALGSSGFQTGRSMLNNTGTATYDGSCYASPGGAVLFLVYGSPWATVTSTAPFTWGSTDFVTWNITLELDYE